MTINERTLEITTFQYDYNVPVTFKAICDEVIDIDH